ncbi:hypothetical protein FRC03_007016, partial [Tulasnella sp. 419]
MSFLRSQEDRRANGIILPKRNPIDTYQRYLAGYAASSMGLPGGDPKHGNAIPVFGSDAKLIEPSSPSVQSIKESLKEHLQIAIMIELSTIPVYLYALYSVKDPKEEAVLWLRSIAMEEMLHLALAGNVYLALSDGPADTPRLYHSPDFPCYPSQMINRKPDLELQLRKLDHEFIELGKKVECRVHEFEEEEAMNSTSDEYESLGQFYRGCIKLIENLPPGSFDPGKKNRQILIEDMVYMHHSNHLEPIVDVPSAIRALDIIIEQGEGAKAEDKESHLFKFNHMQPPQSGTWPIPVNPAEQKLRAGSDLARVSDLFDGCYCYLLLSIEELWKTDPGTTRRSALGHNIRTMMRDILAPLAWWLVETQVENEESPNAAPCFGFFDFEKDFMGTARAYDQLNDLAKSLSGR